MVALGLLELSFRHWIPDGSGAKSGWGVGGVER
jgi:hypothetical protein